MMNRATIFSAITLIGLCICPLRFSRGNDGELMSSHTARRLGLQEQWRRQLRVPAGAASIVDQQIIVHQTEPHEFVEVIGSASDGEKPPVLFQIPVNKIGPDGLPIGKAEAERLARREVRRMKRHWGETTIQSSTSPRIYLYTAAKNGTIECRDAESGKPIWMTQVGRYELTFGKMGINDKFLSLTNGGNLIKIDVTNGEPINTVRTTSTPLYGAIHAGDFSLVPTIRNGVEGYPLADTTVVPFMEIVSGLALEPPTKSPTSSKIAWGTDRGFVYVMELSGEPSVLFRLDTDGIVSGRIASGEGDRFFFGSEGGQVYGLRATRTGKVLWSRPYGEPFYKAPFLMDGTMFLPSVYGNLYALEEKTGLGVWDRPVTNVDEILGGFDNQLFVRLLSGSFAVIDIEKGRLVDIDHALKPLKLLVNRSTDRLYLVNSIGTVQCLARIGKNTPTISRSIDPGDENKRTGSSADQPSAPKSKPAGDPFDVPANPFGTDDANPFGDPGGDDAGAGNPFDAPGEMANPFGEQPFN